MGSGIRVNGNRSYPRTVPSGWYQQALQVFVTYEYEIANWTRRAVDSDHSIIRRSHSLRVPHMDSEEVGRRFALSQLREPPENTIHVTIPLVYAPYLEGDTIELYRNDQNISGSHLIQSVRMSYPEGVVSLVCGEHETDFYDDDYQTQDRVHTLEALREDDTVPVTDQIMHHNIKASMVPYAAIDGKMVRAYTK